MTHPFAGIALHTWTLDTTPFADVLKAAKTAGFDAIEVRRIDFTRSFKSGMDNAQVLNLIRQSGLKVAAVGVEYGWMFAPPSERKPLMDVFRQCCENAVALNCPMLMSAIGPGDASIDDAVEITRRAGDIAAEFGLRLAIEFQFGHPIVDTLQQLRDIVARAQRPAVGLLLDAYHLQRADLQGSAFTDIAPEELFYFQYSDVPDAPVPVFPPIDRLPPGQGEIDWTAMLRALARTGYKGYLSYEAPNPAQWERQPLAAAQEGLIATRDALRAAFP
jgi:2-keto-myo-inositol isomerase